MKVEFNTVRTFVERLEKPEDIDEMTGEYFINALVFDPVQQNWVMVYTVEKGDDED